MNNTYVDLYDLMLKRRVTFSATPPRVPAAPDTIQYFHNTRQIVYQMAQGSSVLPVENVPTSADFCSLAQALGLNSYDFIHEIGHSIICDHLPSSINQKLLEIRDQKGFLFFIIISEETVAWRLGLKIGKKWNYFDSNAYNLHSKQRLRTYEKQSNHLSNLVGHGFAVVIAKCFSLARN